MAIRVRNPLLGGRSFPHSEDSRQVALRVKRVVDVGERCRYIGLGEGGHEVAAHRTEATVGRRGIVTRRRLTIQNWGTGWNVASLFRMVSGSG